MDGDCSHENKGCFLLGRIAMTKLDRCFCIKNQKHHFADKGPSSQTCDFSSSHEYM